MATSANTAGPSPMLLWDTLNAYQRTAALRAAIELELFTRIGRGEETAASLAAQCGAAERGIRILADYLTVCGFLTKEQGKYRLTQDTAAFLDQNSPAYMGGVLQFIDSRDLISAFDNVTELVRRGTTMMPGAGVVDKNDPVWVDFARSMIPFVKPATEFIAAMVSARGPQRVLDIAAGHGLFGIEIARRNPLAQITAVDWHDVLAIAKQNAEAAGVGGRYHLLEGDAFEVDFMTGYDTVLLTNILHHFDRPACERLLRKVRASLAAGGRAITLEFVPNDDRVSPPIPAQFSFMMLGLTPAGDAYTFAQLKAMCEAAGFSQNELVEVPRSPESIVISSI